MSRRHERPIKRTNPSGVVVWVARYTNRHGDRKSAGTFARKGACQAEQRDGQGRAVCCAQHAIDAAYERDAQAPRRPDTVGTYAETWTQRHPRAERTNTTNDGRVNAVLDIELEGLRFRDWPLGELRRRHANALVDHMLRVQGRAATGAQNILRTLSAMAENAIDDELMDANPFKGVKVRANDPRVQKAPKKVRVLSWQQMHALAAAAGEVRTGKDEPSQMDRWRPVYAEPMLRVLSDCGARLGELLPLERRDLKGAGVCDEEDCGVQGPHLHIRRTAHNGLVLQGTKTDHGESSAGRVVPVAAGLEGLLLAMPKRIDTRLLFPTPRGRLWMERNFYRDVWDPARKASGVACTPHDFRHTWVSRMRAALVDAADLADAAGHTVETATKRYTHGLGRSFDAMREAVGE